MGNRYYLDFADFATFCAGSQTEKNGQLVRTYSEEPSYFCPRRGKVRRQRTLAVTEVCKRIRSGSLPLPFAVNTFHFDTRVWRTEGRWSSQQSSMYRAHLLPTKRWIQQIGQCAEEITRLEIDSACCNRGTRIRRQTIAGGIYVSQCIQFLSKPEVESLTFHTPLAMFQIFSSKRRHMLSQKSLRFGSHAR